MGHRRAAGGAEQGCGPERRVYRPAQPRAATPRSSDDLLQRLASQVGEHLRSTPVEILAAARVVRIRMQLRHFLRRFRRGDNGFEYRGRSLKPVHHPYNRTWLNERQLELAVAFDFLDRMPSGSKGLEVGNVLSHYRSIDHEVVDKYETAPGVVNTDVADLAPGARFHYIVAISTLEHVGWDESPREPRKAVRALSHLRSLLLPGGTLLLTVPLGHNGALDAEVLTLDVPGAETYVLDRAWRWCRREVENHNFAYRYELRSAQAIWVGEIPADSISAGPAST